MLTLFPAAFMSPDFDFRDRSLKDTHSSQPTGSLSNLKIYAHKCISNNTFKDNPRKTTSVKGWYLLPHDSVRM